LSEPTKVKVRDKRGLGRADLEAKSREAEPEEAPAPPAELREGPREEKDPQAVMAEQADQILRLHAEFENYRKRAEREKKAFKRYAQEDLIKAILPQLDNLERALEACRCTRNQAGDPLAEGVELTLKGILDVLAKFGVQRIEALGQTFDPSLHEAVMQQPDPDQEENTVLAETQAGYLLHDRLLRPAMVVVSRRPTAEEK